jgi:CheY-like chemotaxis protein
MGVPVVLVIEDDWFLRDCIAGYLRGSQLRTLEARTGELALSFLEAGSQLDLIFTDIQLGRGINGWEVATRFRRALPFIPIIYTSGNGFEPTRAVAKSLFFDKPYELETIAKACRSLVNGGCERQSEL